MTIFRVVSDIHLEHRLPGTYDDRRVEDQMNQALPAMSGDAETTLILAGDISSFHPQRRMMLEWASKWFREVVYVPGNHEHYQGRLDTWNDEAAALEQDFEGLYVGRMGRARQFQLSDLTVIYATMWAPYGVHDPLREMKLNGTSDCWWIQADATGRKCTAKDFQALYTAELASIKDHLVSAHAAGKETVVVTHHVPSLKLRHPDYKEDVADDMFMAPEAENFFAEEWAPKFWFFGHTHKAWDMQIGNTRCISNPYGYPGEKYQGWISAKVV